MNVKNDLHTFVWPDFAIKFKYFPGNVDCEWCKIYHSKFGTLETIKSRHNLFPRSSLPVRFNSSDIHRSVSTQDFEFITKLKSHQISNFLKNQLSPVWAYARCYNDQRAGRTS